LTETEGRGHSMVAVKQEGQGLAGWERRDALRSEGEKKKDESGVRVKRDVTKRKISGMPIGGWG